MSLPVLSPVAWEVLVSVRLTVSDSTTVVWAVVSVPAEVFSDRYSPVIELPDRTDPDSDVPVSVMVLEAYWLLDSDDPDVPVAADDFSYSPVTRLPVAV